MPEQPQQQEQPIYVLVQLKKRAIIPKIIILLILGIVFYFGVLLNVSLLELTGDEETTIKMVSLIVVIVVVLFGILLSILRAKKMYKFYRDRIMFGKKTIPLAQITNTAAKQNSFDKIFKTYSIKLSKKFKIKHISQEVQIQNYLQQLVSYAMAQQPAQQSTTIS